VVYGKYEHLVKNTPKLFKNTLNFTVKTPLDVTGKHSVSTIGNEALKLTEKSIFIL